ncbi:MAG: TRAP transporter substrate-binding protein DctP [Deltaproteobacteria bacterium]|nr:TRAP transporter substrate-binding protein DctP [Deltaproteobacteria bacterium]
MIEPKRGWLQRMSSETRAMVTARRVGSTSVWARGRLRQGMGLTLSLGVALASLAAPCVFMPRLAGAATPASECLKKLRANPKVAEVELKMVTLAPAGSQWAKSFQSWTDEALSASDCRLWLRWYWNGGGGGDEVRMVADLRQGQRHGAAMTGVGLGEIYKDVLIFQAPGLFANWPELDAARDAERPFFEAEFRKRGFEIIGWGDVGAGKIMTVGFPVRRPEDLKGRGAWHLPGDPVAPKLLAKLGAKARPTSIGEVGSHLGKDIQAIASAPYVSEQLQLASKITNITVITPVFITGALVIKKEMLDAMPDDLRAIFQSTGKKAAETLTKTIRFQDGEALKRMKQTKEVYQPNAEDMKAWQEAFREARMSLRGAPFTPEVFDRIVKH